MLQSPQEAQEPQVTPEWPPAGWLTKATAAKRLDLSESRVAAMQGKEIQSKSVRNPATKQINTLFHEGDVERILWARQHPEVTKVLATNPENPENPNTPTPLALPAPEPATTPDDEPEGSRFIGLTAAAKRLGLSAKSVANLALNGALLAVDVGETSVRLRFHEDTLDAFRGVNLATYGVQREKA
jgi:hypothetical protein